MQNYHRYYGRRTSHFRGFFKTVLILILLLLLVLLLSALFFQRYLVYDDNGVRLELPWSQQDAEQSSPAPSVPLVTPPQIVKEEVSATPEPEPELPEPIPFVHAVQIDPSALTTVALPAGADGVVVPMKGDDGKLSFVTNHPLAVRVGASSGDPAQNDAIRALTAGNLYTVAQVSCFRDHRTSSVASEHKLSTASGYCWEDRDNIRWTSPADREVWDYLTALCIEIAELGFDEILLTNCGYPTVEQGNLDWIRKDEAYPEGSLDTVIAAFLRHLHTALEPYEVKLSVCGLLPELQGDTAYTGLTLENALANCDRIWVTDAAWEPVAASAQITDPEWDPARQLVRIRDVPGEENTSWAILN